VEALPVGSLFFVVDSYEGREEDYEQLLSNIVQRKVTHRVSPLRGSLREVIAYLSREKVVLDLVYWEGEGKKEEIRGGLEGLFPLLRPGGVVFIEDLFQGQKGREVGRGVEEFRRLHQMSWEDMDGWNTGPWIWSLTKAEGFKLRSLPVAARVTTAPTEIHPLTPLKTPPTWEEVEESVFASPTWDVDTCHLPICRDFLKYFLGVNGLTLEAVHKRRAHNLLRQKEIMRSLLTNKLPPESRIPHLLHRVWVTSDTDPYEVPPDRLRCYLSTIHTELPADWKHCFWCLDKTKIPETVKALEETGRVEVKELKEIWSRLRGREVFERLINARLYTQCCDVIRLNVVDLFGGVYTDFGVQFLRDPSLLLDHFDVVVGRSGYLCSPGFIAMSSQNSALEYSLRIIDNLDRIPVDVRNLVSQATRAPLWVAHGILTVGVDVGLPEQARFLALHHEVPSSLRTDARVFKNPFFKTNCMGSWVSGNAFGQVPLREIDPQALFFPKEEWESFFPLVKWMNMQEEGHGLIEAFSRVFFGERREELIRKKKTLLKYSSRIFHDLKAQPRYSTPHISHRIWVTRSTEAPKTHLETYVESTQTLGPSWEHFFWCIDPAAIPETIAYLTQKIPRIKIMKINDVFQVDGEEDAAAEKKHMFGGRVFRELFNLSAFVATTDILRKNLLFYYGGLYCDMGVSFKRDLTSLIDTYDFLFYFQPTTKFLDLGLMACEPNSPPILGLLKVLDNLKEFPREIRGASELSIIGAHLFNSFFLHYCAEETRLLPVIEGYFIKNIRMGSWLTGGQNNTPFFEAIKVKSIFDM
jgi:mannosyltransferase OCH1-like enzyme